MQFNKLILFFVTAFAMLGIYGCGGKKVALPAMEGKVKKISN